MEIDKVTRNEIYKRALVLYRTEAIAWAGFCWTINKVLTQLNMFNMDTDAYYYMALYPEILKHRPKNASTWWWSPDNTEIRINILEQAIKETS